MLARRARTPLSWEHVFDFRRCDVALSSLITYNRPDASTCATRRRAVGAVGPSRTNDLTYSGVFSNAAWVKTNVTLGAGVADPRGGTTAFTLTAGASEPKWLTQTLSAGASLMRVNSLWLRRRTGTSNVNLWSPDVGTPLVISALPSTWTRYEAPNASAATARTLLLELTATGDEVDIWEGQLELGGTATPNIPTTSAAVTTTDWSRTNYIAKSNKFSSALWSRVQSGTGVVPSIVSEVVPSPTGSLDATRITFNQGAGDTLGDESVVNYYQAASLTTGAPYCAGIWARIPLGVTISARTVGSSAYTALVGTGHWKRYALPETAGSAFATVTIGLRGGLGIGASTGSVTVDLWHCTLEDGSELTATIPNDTTAPLTVNTPPYGQLVTVPANVPVLEYDKDGIGRGLRVDSAAAQLLATTKGFKANWNNYGPMTGWVDNYGVAPDGTVTTTFAPDNSTAYEVVSATIGVPLKFSVHVRAGTAPYYSLYADGAGLSSNAYIDRVFGTHVVIGTSGPVTAYGIDGDEVDGMQRVWFEVTPTATGNIAFHIYPISGTAEFWGANVTTGPLTSYIEGQFTRAAASALMVPSTVGLTTTSGSVLIDCEVSNTNGVLWQVGSSYSDRLMVYRDNATLRLYCVRDGSEQLGGVWIGAPFSGGNRARVALAWASGKIYASVNGGAPSTFNAGVPVSFADLALAHYLYGDGYQIDGVIRELRTTSRTLSLPELVRESAL